MSFAKAAQELFVTPAALSYQIKKLEDEGSIPKLPVFLDSPMALEALRYYASRASELDDDIKSDVEIRRFFTARFQAVASAQQSAEAVKPAVTPGPEVPMRPTRPVTRPGYHSERPAPHRISPG